MHNKFFSYPTVEAKHRNGLFGAYFDCFVTWMQEHGYTYHTMETNIKCVTHFGKYLKRKGIHDIHRLEGVEGQKFLVAYRRYRNGKHKGRSSGAGRFIRVLEEAGVLRNSNCSSLLFHETQQYLNFLKGQRGLSEGTIYYHKLWVEKFLQFLGCQKADSSLPGFGIADVDRFIEKESIRLKRDTQSTLTGVLRSFFRFLYQSGKLATDLSHLVTSPRRYRLESLPRVLNWEEVQKVLDSVERSTEIGIRDYTILILLATYGLRAGEVARLRLKNIDWRNETIHITRRKMGEDLWLPLTPQVGKAILKYLKHGRPVSSYREIFLLSRAPRTPVTKSIISWVAEKHVHLAGLNPPREGAHLFRHTFATHLHNRGVPLKQIGDLLGHRHSESTHLYTKTANERLREVALEVPEEIRLWKTKK